MSLFACVEGRVGPEEEEGEERNNNTKLFDVIFHYEKT
jgi:hypothetical protein